MARTKAREAGSPPVSAGGLAAARTAVDTRSVLAEYGRHRLLTPDEELDLAARVRQGDSTARNALVEANMRLVVNLAKPYASSLIPLEDLVQEGAIGLITACERFDPARGFRFSTYATYWIRHAIGRAIDGKARTIRVPAHIAETARRSQRARAALLREGHEPTVEQIAARLGLPARRVERSLGAVREPVSLDALVGDEGDTRLGALLGDAAAADPEGAVLHAEMAREVGRLLASLPDKEQCVMRQRLGIEDGVPRVLQEIGDELNVSRERVRQLEAQALKRLRSPAIRARVRERLLG